jgi:hypothetical protein
MSDGPPPDDAPAGKKLTRYDVVQKLNAVPTFRIADAASKGMCATVIPFNGKAIKCGTYFADIEDARELLGKIKEHNAGMDVVIDIIPMGDAFAHCEQWIRTQPMVPLRMLASAALLKQVEGFPDLPEEVRGVFNPLSSKFPLWTIPELHTDTDMPFFMRLADLREAWSKASGRPPEELSTLEAIDMRMLVGNMCSQQKRWDLARIVAPSESLEFWEQHKREAVENGDEPPPLDDAPAKSQATPAESRSGNGDGDGGSSTEQGSAESGNAPAVSRRTPSKPTSLKVNDNSSFNRNTKVRPQHAVLQCRNACPVDVDFLILRAPCPSLSQLLSILIMLFAIALATGAGLALGRVESTWSPSVPEATPAGSASAEGA